MDVRTFTVGAIMENAYVARRDNATKALLIDPGAEPERLLEAFEQLGVEIEAILITHTHFDHIGALAPVARATGAPVYCPALEVEVMRDPNRFLPPGYGPIEGYEPDELVEGGERLTLAGLEIEVLFTPGHSAGHVTYAIEDEQVLFSGDVLFRGSIGRTDLPGGDAATLLDSIGRLYARFPLPTTVYPGHMGATTLGRERAGNPFLASLAQQ